MPRRRNSGDEDILLDEKLEPYLKGKGPTFRVETWDTGRMERGRRYLGFRVTMTEPGKSPEVVYEGDEYSPSPSYEVDDPRTIDDIIAFFTNETDDEEKRTRRQREVVSEHGDALSMEASARFGEDAELEENPGSGGLYAVRLVHKISPSDRDTMPAVSLPEGAFSNRNMLARALRDAGVLSSGTQLASFRVEGDKVVAFPRGGIWHSVILTSEGEASDRTPNGQNAWVVTLNGEVVEIVYYDADMDADDVKRSLVRSDGFDPGIKVKPRERRRTHAPDMLATNASRKRFAPGTKVRLTAKFLRSTGQHRGSEGHSVWKVIEDRGDMVLVDEPWDLSLTEQELKADPSLKWRRIARPNLQQVGKPDYS
mgnify:CR=1 FL=1